MHLEIEAGDFSSALRMTMARAWTRLDEAEMLVAQFDAGSNQDRPAGIYGYWRTK